MAVRMASIQRPIGLLLIDLQRAFVDGIWRANLPDEEVEPIKKSFQNCANLLGSGLNNVPTLMARCYFQGSDFELHDSLTSVVGKNQRYVIKPSTSVMHAHGFREWVEEKLLKQGINTLVIGGCTTTSCVRVSSVRTHKAFASKGLQVVVDLSLCGARKCNYVQRCPSCFRIDFGDFDPSRNPHCTCGGVDVEMISPVDKAVQSMQDKGVEVMETFDWKPYQL
ncbi:hypothetical protein OS493_014692 [Desmophyllum pertusum]|uniref:Isochorismatase-like domain-containing protein n=1 Tax=Desmophyllum pertusum TaxID=174260 RepID=A0A9W9YGF0_9CNID|nr:hypothetical protein OS493_014692 [Desmophyllum pertusum]